MVLKIGLLIYYKNSRGRNYRRQVFFFLTSLNNHQILLVRFSVRAASSALNLCAQVFPRSVYDLAAVLLPLVGV